MPILDDISKGLKQGAEKASDALKTLEINQEISKLEGTINEKKVALGNAVLALHVSNKLDLPELKAICAEVDALNAQIEDKKKLIHTIQND